MSTLVFIHFTVLVHRTSALTAPLPPPCRTVRGPQRPRVGEHRTQGARRQRFPQTKSTAQQDSVSLCRYGTVTIANRDPGLFDPWIQIRVRDKFLSDPGSWIPDPQPIALRA
jgi:hypothetical protein